MAASAERLEDGPCAKRVRLSNEEVIEGGCRLQLTSTIVSDSEEPQLPILEVGAAADCDSGCEISSLLTSPPCDLDIIVEGLSDPTTHLDTSQDSLELEDDNVSTVSHLSELSGLSEMSGKGWKPTIGNMVWIRSQMQKRVDPRLLLHELGAEADQIPQSLDDITLWKIIVNMLAEPPRRHKLRHVNTLDDIVRLLKGAQKIIILTGAGVSVSCGIPDFRSRDGIYTRLAADFPDLPHPQAMFDINYFKKDPRPFYKFAKDIYPGKFQPSPCHRFIRLMEKNRKLLRNYTQNIDTLEKVAGIENVVECHGSFATATCTKCSHRVTAEEIQSIVLSQRIPLCAQCHPDAALEVDAAQVASEQQLHQLVENGIMKPDIVFFGEDLPAAFHDAMAADKGACDLLLVVGSSLKVKPVALIPTSLPPHVPQILINREPLPHCHFDVELLGDCDVIVNHICQLLGNTWQEGVVCDEQLRETLQLQPLDEPTKFVDFSSKFDDVPDVADSDISCTYSAAATNDAEESDADVKVTKERHMSIDSARDSGIGENSNFTDVDVGGEGTSPASSSSAPALPEGPAVDLRGFWQPKVKRSLADRLPEGSFYLVPPSRYIFPGAEVFYDPDEKYFDTSSDSSDSESETETAAADTY